MKKRSKSERVPETIADYASGNAFQHLSAKPSLLMAPGPPIIETVFFSKVGHTFKKLPPIVFPGGPARYAVQDFLLDQTGTSGADGKMSPLKPFDLTTAISYRFNLLPKTRNKRIKVKIPGLAIAFFSLDVGRRFVNAASDFADQYTSHTFFTNLVGLTPTFTYNSFFIGHNTNHWIHFVVMADVVTSIVFSGFTTYGIYPPRSFDPGIKSYKPYSDSVPFNLQSPIGVPHCMFSYVTDNPVDPGPFVFLS